MASQARKVDSDWSAYWRQRALQAERRAERYEATARAAWQNQQRVQYLERELESERWKSEGRKNGLVDIATGDCRRSCEGKTASAYARFMLMLYEHGPDAG